MSVARPLLRALLRAEAAWRRAAREAMQRSASATAAPLTSTSSSLDETSTSPAAALLRFREPMDTSAWQRGRHGWALGGPIYHCKAAKMALGSGGEGALPWGPITSGVFRGLQLRRLILRNFRAAEAAFKEGHALELSAAEDAGFAALRALGEQRAMERCSSDSVSANGIRVEATAALVAALPSSSSSRSSFVFGSSGSGPMRSVSSAGPGVIVITSVEGGSSDDDDDDDEDEDSDEDEEDSDEDSGAARRVGLASASLSSSSAASSLAPGMRYVFTYRLRITRPAAVRGRRRRRRTKRKKRRRRLWRRRRSRRRRRSGNGNGNGTDPGPPLAAPLPRLADPGLPRQAPRRRSQRVARCRRPHARVGARGHVRVLFVDRPPDAGRRDERVLRDERGRHRRGRQQ